jgi:hypothetical protein
MPQAYPPGNGKGGISHNRWYVDDITGALIPECRAVRDYHDRLVDNLDVDDLSATALREHWSIRTEDWPEDP